MTREEMMGLEAKLIAGILTGGIFAAILINGAQYLDKAKELGSYSAAHTYYMERLEGMRPILPR